MVESILQFLSADASQSAAEKVAAMEANLADWQPAVSHTLDQHEQALRAISEGLTATQDSLINLSRMTGIFLVLALIVVAVFFWRFERRFKRLERRLEEIENMRIVVHSPDGHSLIDLSLEQMNLLQTYTDRELHKAS